MAQKGKKVVAKDVSEKKQSFGWLHGYKSLIKRLQIKSLDQSYAYTKVLINCLQV